MKEAFIFRARELWLKEPIPYKDREIILIEVRMLEPGRKYTYHIGGTGRTSAIDIGREKAQELLQKGGGADFFIKSDR